MEKVVSTPQNPTANNICCVFDTDYFVLKNPNIKPSNKQPVAFAISVAKGNCVDTGLIISPMQYRKRLPSPPPMKTSKKELMLMLHQAF